MQRAQLAEAEVRTLSRQHQQQQQQIQALESELLHASSSEVGSQDAAHQESGANMDLLTQVCNAMVQL